MNYIEIVILFCSLFSSKSEVNCDQTDDNNLSSLAGYNKLTNQSFQRQLELNWRNIPIDSQHQWIGLFGEEPESAKVEKRGRKYSIQSISISGPSGSHRTTVEFPHQNFSKRNLTSKCLKYWIGYIKQNRVVAKSCIRNNPFWMEDSLGAIGEKSLLDLMIPGTHNSASYDRYDPKDHNILHKYTLCQDESVWNQLVYGIRFLDLRVSYENVKGDKYKLWIVHGPIRMKQTLQSVILQVKQFVQLATREVLIVDLHRFEKGFHDNESSPDRIRKRHLKVVALLLKHLKDYLVPLKMGLNSTINQLISQNKRIIVGYAGNHYVNNEYLFDSTKHLWANTDTINELSKYFNRTICQSYPNILYSAMVQLTPDRVGIISDRYKGLRTMAQTVNYNITESFKKSWHKCANVVASDYFLGNHLIEIAIQTNLLRSRRSTHTSSRGSYPSIDF